jgi:hypothetical protein
MYPDKVPAWAVQLHANWQEEPATADDALMSDERGGADAFTVARPRRPTLHKISKAIIDTLDLFMLAQPVGYVLKVTKRVFRAESTQARAYSFSASLSNPAISCHTHHSTLLCCLRIDA